MWEGWGILPEYPITTFNFGLVMSQVKNIKTNKMKMKIYKITIQINRWFIVRIFFSWKKKKKKKTCCKINRTNKWQPFKSRNLISKNYNYINRLFKVFIKIKLSKSDSDRKLIFILCILYLGTSSIYYFYLTKKIKSIYKEFLLQISKIIN